MAAPTIASARSRALRSTKGSASLQIMIKAVVLCAAVASAAVLEPIGYDREASALAYLQSTGLDVVATDMSFLNNAAPNLVSLIAMAKDDPTKLARIVAESPLAAVAKEVAMPEAAAAFDADGTPVVVAHGMGDSRGPPIPSIREI